MNRCNTTDQIGYYFRKEKWLLLIIAVTGILYNAGMVAGPWFEGQMVQYLCDIIGKKRKAIEMVMLAICFVCPPGGFSKPDGDFCFPPPL